MYRQILVPLDMSREAEAVLPIARQLASSTGATLNLLGVATGAGPGCTRKLCEYLEDVATTERESGLEVCVRLRIGDPATEIVTFGREVHVDLIVMATHGRTGLSRILLGSVAEKVAHNSEAPVLLLRGGTNDDLMPPTWVGRKTTPRGVVTTGASADTRDINRFASQHHGGAGNVQSREDYG
jgi:nucleotide-binding universal stress UspA family protein